MKLDLTPNEYMNVMFERQERINREYEEFLTSCILYERIQLTDIPINIMLLSRRINLTVFRVARSDCKLAIDVLKLIFDEYENISKDEKFMERLACFIFNECDNQFGNNEDYQTFRKSISGDILAKLEKY